MTAALTVDNQGTFRDSMVQSLLERGLEPAPAPRGEGRAVSRMAAEKSFQHLCGLLRVVTDVIIGDEKTGIMGTAPGTSLRVFGAVIRFLRGEG